jgi:hypothetical protein
LALAAILAAGVVLWTRRAAAAPDVPTGNVASGPTTNDAEEKDAEEEDAEEWVASVARDGVGHIRRDTQDPERAQISSYVTLGALAQEGREALVTTIRSELEELETSLESRLSRQNSDSQTNLGDYEKELKLLSRIELLRARIELVQNGVYITIPLSGNTAESVPREPTGVVSATYGAYPVLSGELAQVLLWVTSDKRQAMRDLNDSLRDIRAARREEWIDQFNAKPEEQRRGWFQRFRKLQSRVRDGVLQLSNAELTEWLTLRETVRRLRLQLSDESWTVH